MSLNSAIATLAAREAVLTQTDDQLMLSALQRTMSPEGQALYAAYQRLKERFCNVDPNMPLYPHETGQGDWWTNIYPTHENGRKTFLQFSDGEHTWTFWRASLNGRFLIGTILEHDETKNMLFDVQDPEHIRVYEPHGRKIFEQIDRLEGGLFAVHDGTGAYLLDDDWQSVSIEGVSRFEDITVECDVCFVTLPVPLSGLACSQRCKARGQPKKDFYLVNPAQRTFVRMPEAYAANTVGYASRVEYRPGIVKFTLRGEVSDYVLGYDVRTGVFLTFENICAVRDISAPTAFVADAGYLEVKLLNGVQHLYRQGDVPGRYVWSGRRYEIFQHCNLDLMPLRAVGDAAGFRLVRQIDGPEHQIVAPDGQTFSLFGQIRPLPSLSGNPANWEAALKVPGGWLCVANDVMLSIDGRYLFDDVEVSPDRSEKVFHCVLDGKRVPVSWYYGFEVHQERK